MLLARMLGGRWNRQLRSFSSLVSSDFVVRSPITESEVFTGSHFELLFKDSHKWGQYVALECADTKFSYTYDALKDACHRWGGYLLKKGIKKGDVIGIFSPNCPQYVPVLHGAQALGIAVTTINSGYTPYELHNQMKDSGAKLLVFSAALESFAKEGTQNLNRPLDLVSIGATVSGVPDFNGIVQDNSIPFAEPVELTGEEPIFIPYSSGTTGKPKGVLLSHNGFNFCTAQFQHPHFFSAKPTTADFQEKFLAMMPFFHIYGLQVILSIGLRIGAKIVTVSKFHPDSYITTIADYKIAFLHTVPTILTALCNQQGFNSQTMGHITNITCGAAPVLPTVVDAITAKIGKEIVFQEGYGLTETLVTHITPSKSQRLGCMGQLLPNNEAKVVDLITGESLPPGQPGEIYLKTPARMIGYLNRPDATQEMTREGGYLCSGDVGFYSEDGYFTIVDRCKELIKVKGLQVSPSEIEDVLQKHPAVASVGVVGIPDKRQEEAPRAYVVLKGKATEQEIKDFVAKRLSKHKHLVGGVKFVEDLPKTGTGKIMRRILIEMYQKEL